jgi:hypothetical protein
LLEAGAVKEDYNGSQLPGIISNSEITAKPRDICFLGHTAV